jgi:hypothetical protein
MLSIFFQNKMTYTLNKTSYSILKDESSNYLKNQKNNSHI